MRASQTDPNERVIVWDQGFRLLSYGKIDDPMGYYRVTLPPNASGKIKIFSDKTGATYSLGKGDEFVTTLDMATLIGNYQYLFMPKFAAAVVRGGPPESGCCVVQ